MTSNKKIDEFKKARLSHNLIDTLIDLTTIKSGRVPAIEDVEPFIDIALEKVNVRIADSKAKLDQTYACFYSWLSFLKTDDHLQEHFDAAKRLSERLRAKNAFCDFYISFYNYPGISFDIKKMYTRIFRKPEFHIRMYEPAIRMSDTDMSALADHLSDASNREFIRILDRIRITPEVSDLYDELQAIRPTLRIPSDTKGKFYDLDDIFDAVNTSMFGGSVPKPVLRWSPRVNIRQMGSYNIGDDVITINRGLDAKEVPEYVLRMIMYHEMLHKVLGRKAAGGRMMAHTAEFRQLEKKYPDYQRTEEFFRRYRFN